MRPAAGSPCAKDGTSLSTFCKQDDNTYADYVFNGTFSGTPSCS